MSKPSQIISSTKKNAQNNTKNKIRETMTKKLQTKTRQFGGTYGNTTTSKSGNKEHEGMVILEDGKPVRYLTA
jgi:hypothetical protein